jgi:hypothetical protein
MRKYLDLTPEAAMKLSGLQSVIDGRIAGINGFVGKTPEGDTMSFLVDDGTVISVQKGGVITEYNSRARTDIEEYALKD